MPMWVIQVKDVLEMTGTMQPHQVLKAQGLLEIWRVTMFTLFVSHQWLSFHHPDPNGEQLKVLQLVLRKLIAKQLTIQGNVWSEYSASKARTKDLDGVGKWYMWLDYFCVPQLVGHSVLGVGEQHSYIESIPSYVDLCSAFVELGTAGRASRLKSSVPGAGQNGGVVIIIIFLPEQKFQSQRSRALIRSGSLRLWCTDIPCTQGTLQLKAIVLPAAMSFRQQ